MESISFQAHCCSEDCKMHLETCAKPQNWIPYAWPSHCIMLFGEFGGGHPFMPTVIESCSMLRTRYRRYCIWNTEEGLPPVRSLHFYPCVLCELKSKSPLIISAELACSVSLCDGPWIIAPKYVILRTVLDTSTAPTSMIMNVIERVQETMQETIKAPSEWEHRRTHTHEKHCNCSAQPYCVGLRLHVNADCWQRASAQKKTLQQKTLPLLSYA